MVASKLCARKHPALIPVRDSAVVEVLRLGSRPNYKTHWLVYRFLLRDQAVAASLSSAAMDAVQIHGAPDLADLPSLRLLDSLLWMTRGGTAYT